MGRKTCAGNPWLPLLWKLHRDAGLGEDDDDLGDLHGSGTSVDERVTKIDCRRVRQSFAVGHQSRSASRQSVRGRATGGDRLSH